MATELYTEDSYINNTFIHSDYTSNKGCNEFVASENVDDMKTVYIIVHGKRDLFEQVQEKLTSKGFDKSRMQKASLDKAGNQGEYVAMVWPPMDPKEIVVSRIVGTATNANLNTPLGAWASVEQKELYKIPL
jgi:hypothetical protein